MSAWGKSVGTDCFSDSSSPLNPDYRLTVSTRDAAWLVCGLSWPWCAGISRCPIWLCDVGDLTACRLLESSADLHDVRDFLGHANITTTSRYVRSTPVRLAQALERMEAATRTLVDADDSPHLAAVR